MSLRSFISAILATATIGHRAPSPHALLRPIATPSPRCTHSFSAGSNQNEHVTPNLVQKAPLLEYPPEGTPQKLAKADAELYLYPLLCHGWKLTSGSDQSLTLNRSLVFKGPISARKFLIKLLEIEEKLWHHANSIHLNGEKRPTLDITAQTHDVVPPGLSLQDVRLAVNLERTYREGDFSPVKGKLAVQTPTALSPEAREKLLHSFL